MRSDTTPGSENHLNPAEGSRTRRCAEGAVHGRRHRASELGLQLPLAPAGAYGRARRDSRGSSAPSPGCRETELRLRASVTGRGGRADSLPSAEGPPTAAGYR